MGQNTVEMLSISKKTGKKPTISQGGGKGELQKERVGSEEALGQLLQKRERRQDKIERWRRFWKSRAEDVGGTQVGGNGSKKSVHASNGKLNKQSCSVEERPAVHRLVTDDTGIHCASKEGGGSS